MDAYFHVQRVLIEAVRTQAGLDVCFGRRVDLPFEGILDGVEFGIFVRVGRYARYIDPPQRRLDGFLPIGTQQPVPQHPISLQLPGELGNVDGENPFDRGARRKIPKYYLLKRVIMVDVLSRQKLR